MICYKCKGEYKAMIKRMTKIILGVVFLSMVTFIFVIVSFSKTLHKEKEIDGTIVAIDSSSLTINTLDEGEYILIPDEDAHNLLNGVNIGDNIKAYYSGEIMESEPGQVVVSFIEVEK